MFDIRIVLGLSIVSRTSSCLIWRIKLLKIGVHRWAQVSKGHLNWRDNGPIVLAQRKELKTGGQWLWTRSFNRNFLVSLASLWRTCDVNWSSEKSNIPFSVSRILSHNPESYLHRAANWDNNFTNALWLIFFLSSNFDSFFPPLSLIFIFRIILIQFRFPISCFVTLTSIW